MVRSKESKVQQEFVAPDGGWGWMIVLGAGISSMVLISVIQTFGLNYKDRFQQLQFSAADTTSLMSINSSFGMILGIFNGPLLKKYGYRKIALIGGLLFVSGLFYSVFAETYIQFLVAYGMISSIGTSMSMSSFSLALNTYFKLKRSLASSFSITIMGMGPILLPLLITYLLSSYGWKWTALIVAACTMNTFVGSLLLQPVTWHVRPIKNEEESQMNGDVSQSHNHTTDTSSLFGTSYLDPAEILAKSFSELNIGKWRSQGSLFKSKLSNYHEISRDKIDQNESAKKLLSVTSLDNEDYGDMMRSTLYILENSVVKDKPMKYASVETLDHRSFKSSPFESEKLLSRSLDLKYTATETPINKNNTEGNNENHKSKDKESGCVYKIIKFLNRMYDFDLLLDPIYINLLIGLSIATVGEIIFSLLTPFIVSELGLNLEETALFMSVTGTTDVVFRFISPFIGQCLKFSSRVMYILSISVLLVTRACLLIPSSFAGFIVVAVFLGVGKGFRTVYWTLVVPDYVPLCKLASATAFQSLSNGISLFISGPIIGRIVANSNDTYVNVVFATNLLTFTTIFMWGIEFIITHQKRKKLKKKLPS